MLRRLFFLSIIMGAVGVPYLMSSSAGWLKDIRARFTSSSQADNGPASDATMAPPHLGEATSITAASFHPSTKPQTLGRNRPRELAEVLQFGGTPAWVLAQWPRVTSGLAQPDLQGYRVPLVTGTAENDLAGSLTYYFDNEQHARFITFRGTTGDPRKLIALVTERYSMKLQSSSNPSLSLYQVHWKGKPVSELRIRPARVLRADQPYARYEVELALMRP